MIQVMTQCFSNLPAATTHAGGLLKRTEGVKRYLGTHREGVLEGVGEVLYGPDCKYQGELKGGKNHGFGVYTWPNRKVVISYWEEGLMHGPGLIIEPNGKSTSGQWEAGKLRTLSPM